MSRLLAERLESEGDSHEAHLVGLARIQECLAGDQPAMVYQPIVALDTGRIVGFEALARFAPDPQRPPDAWFCDQLPETIYLSMNVGAETLCSEKLESNRLVSLRVELGSGPPGGLSRASTNGVRGPAIVAAVRRLRRGRPLT